MVLCIMKCIFCRNKVHPKVHPFVKTNFFNFKLDFGGVIEAQSTPSLPSLGYPLSVDI